MVRTLIGDAVPYGVIGIGIGILSYAIVHRAVQKFSSSYLILSTARTYILQIAVGRYDETNERDYSTICTQICMYVYVYLQLLVLRTYYCTPYVRRI